MRTTIDHAGRIVVPKAIRDELGLAGGQEVDVIARDGHLEVNVAPVAMSLIDRDGIPVAIPAEPLPPLTSEQVRVALERTRR